MSTVLLTNCTLLHLDPPRVEVADVLVQDDRIAGVGSQLTMPVGGKVVDLGGAWLMPGLVCAHTHAYSALACGMPLPKTPPTSFGGMLAEVWWKLDKALDTRAVEMSAAVAGLQALKAGTTTLFDHHASPNAIEGSLGRINAALGHLGLRRVLCYEVSDRDGPAKVKAGLEAHRELADLRGEMCGLLIGGHANFTLSDESLGAMVSLAEELDTGLHMHLAEAVDDLRSTGEPLVHRLARLGALRPGSVFAHGVHLGRDELQRLATANCWLTHQPRSNMNNGVGRAAAEHFGPLSALGTDGIGADMFAELQAAWFSAKHAGADWSPADALQMLTGGARLATDVLGLPIGHIEPGAAADMVVLDPPPGPPLRDENLAATLIFNLSAGAVRHVMIAGAWRLWDRAAPGVDEAAMASSAAKAARRTWNRMADNPFGPILS
jgi:cytosine/adenosine deaminase-related metal-dependent hydrolase